MPKPPNVAHPYAPCPKCGRRSRAVIAHTNDGRTVVHYVATSKPSQDLVLRTFRIRPDQAEKLDKLPPRTRSAHVRDALDRV